MREPELPLQLITVTNADELSSHLDAWTDLLARASVGDWFASPLWLMPWMRAFGEHCPWHLILGYHGSELVGALPLIGPLQAPWGHGQLRQPVNVQVRRVGLLAAGAHTEFTRRALQLAIERSPNGCVELGRMIARGSFDTLSAQAVAEQRWGMFEQEEQSSAVADFADGWDSYVASRDGKVLRNLRSRRRKIDADGNWRFQVVDTPKDVSNFWQDVLRIEADSWKHDAKSALTSEPQVAAFYYDVLLRAADARVLRCHMLTHADEPVAYAAGLLIGGTYYLLKNSYRESFKSWSPGMVLIWHSMEESANNGAVRYDFLGDVLPWKRDLATELPAYITRNIFSRFRVSAQLRWLIEQQIKPLVRQSGVLTTLRNLRYRG